MLNKIYKIFFSVAIVISIFILWRNISKGFKVHKIYFSEKPKISLFSKIDNKTNSFMKENKKLVKILDQKFFYLSKGSQTYVFRSEDGKYVLKFISFNKYKEPFRRKLLYQFKIFNSFLNKKKNSRKRNLKRAVESYKIAFCHLKKETQIKYINFNKNEKILQKIHIVDKLKNNYKIDPNKTFFILQKKAIPISCIFSKNIKQDKEKAKKILLDYLDLTKKILEKGIINRDSCIKNTGYVKDKLIEMDTGRFFYIKNIEKKECFNAFLEKYTFFYKKFLEKKSSSLYVFFEKEVKKIKK